MSCWNGGSFPLRHAMTADPGAAASCWESGQRYRGVWRPSRDRVRLSATVVMRNRRFTESTLLTLAFFVTISVIPYTVIGIGILRVLAHELEPPRF